ncbi:hypothetical protein BDV39DRAFT_167127 [Aspergillus sergii]|uniref:Uncharacterized protein n=1 Tax=Aspergillus sergii TaxID=1034303 RepID=A0A5N6XHU7_9EURO|nr:hypothetical protein BDV39DRAFT_167127 [Aspergillus sergii]
MASGRHLAPSPLLSACCERKMSPRPMCAKPELTFSRIPITASWSAEMRCSIRSLGVKSVSTFSPNIAVSPTVVEKGYYLILFRP